MQKFGRNYTLIVGTPFGGSVTIAPPFTVEFDITRNTLTSANVCSIRIYNLSANNRNQIRFNIMDSSQFRAISFYAGYGQNLPLVFSGNITQAWSVREGTNFVTTIECFDGGFAYTNGKIDQSFPKNYARTSVITSIISTMPTVKAGTIGSYPGFLLRGQTISGNSMEELKTFTNGGVFIDNGKVNCLGTNEVLSSSFSTIDASSGLLGTPLREWTRLTFDMIFEPRIVIGQSIKLESTEGVRQRANYNGTYKVVSVKHRGTISSAVCGDAVSSVGLFIGTQAFAQASPL